MEIIPEVISEIPIEFLSHWLSKSQIRWPTIERECYAINYALQKLNFYLHNVRFTIKTDHKPLVDLLKRGELENRKLRIWGLIISAFSYEVMYLWGAENTCADLLSRKPVNRSQENSDDDVGGDLDKALEVNVLNFNMFDPRRYYKYCVNPREDETREPSSLD